MTARPSRLEPWLFAGALVALLLPLAVFDYFPSQDGPAHAAMAHVMRDLGGPAGAAMGEYFEWSPGAVPNELTFAIVTWGLGFLPLLAAEKVLLALLVLGLPLGVRYAVTAFDRRAGPVAWLALPFVYNHLLLLGFFNFVVGLVGFLLAVGFGERSKGRPARGWAPVLAGLAVGIYLCHPVALAATGAFLVGQALLDSWRDRACVRQRLVPILLALVPSFVALGLFAGARAGASLEWQPLGVRLWQLATLYTLVALDPWTRLAAVGTAACLGCTALWLLRRRLRTRRWEASDALPLLAAGLALVDLLAPDSIAGGGFLNQRLILFPWLLLLLWAAARSGELARAVRWAPLAGALLTAAQLAALLPIWAASDRLLAEAATIGPQIAPGSTLLSLSFAPEGRAADGSRGLVYRSSPFQHLGGYVAAERNIVDLALYAAHEDYFPIRYRSDRDPYVYLGGDGGIEAVPPRVDLAGYEAKTGGRVDYVLVWQLGEEQRTLPATRSLEAQLAAGYAVAFTSARGNAWLYRRVAREAASASRTGPASAVATAR